MWKKLMSTRSLCLSAIIAALYAALTLLLPAISYGELQCRVSEALTVLPILLLKSLMELLNTLKLNERHLMLENHHLI